jgi:hypothetical protein
MTSMTRTEAWKNFDLGSELNVAGTFLYNGLWRFHTLTHLENADEIFEVSYQLAVGFERLLKVAVVLLEHEEGTDQESLERSLITHDQVALLARVKKRSSLRVSKPQTKLLVLLSAFYKSVRYDRFTIGPKWQPDKEKTQLHKFLSEALNVTLRQDDGFLANANENRFRRFMARTVQGLAQALYLIVWNAASQLNLYTYEMRSDSKAARIFLDKRVGFEDDDILRKELLLFFMASDASRGVFAHMRSLNPLRFDPALADEYVACILGAGDTSGALSELDDLYSEVDDVGNRLASIAAIGDSAIEWDSPDDDSIDDDDLGPS